MRLVAVRKFGKIDLDVKKKTASAVQKIFFGANPPLPPPSPLPKCIRYISAYLQDVEIIESVGGFNMGVISEKGQE